MKKKTPEQELKALCNNIRQEIDRWEHINQNGCNDPGYADGTNTNLTRNHIIYAKRQIVEICERHGIPVPEEMYIPIPPVVNEYYMASLKQKRRVELIGHPERLITKRNKYDREQLSIF